MTPEISLGLIGCGGTGQLRAAAVRVFHPKLVAVMMSMNRARDSFRKYGATAESIGAGSFNGRSRWAWFQRRLTSTRRVRAALEPENTCCARDHSRARRRKL